MVFKQPKVETETDVLGLDLFLSSWSKNSFLERKKNRKIGLENSYFKKSKNNGNKRQSPQ